MASKIIELRQADADRVNANGDYDMTLKYTNDLIVEEGDQIMIKNIFVDTLAQSNQQINISQTMTLNLKHYFYYIYSRQDNLEEWLVGEGLPPIDGKPYFLAYENSGGVGTQTITGFDVIGTYHNPPTGGTVTIKYIQPDGTPGSQNVNYPSAGPNSGDSYQGCNIKILAGSATSATSSERLGVELNISATSGGSLELEAISLDTVVTIPSGNYSPDQLVAEFNRIAQSARKGSVENQVYENNFLKSSDNLVSDYGAGKIYLQPADGGKPIKVKDDANLLVGASFVELAYIPEQQQFAFEYIHTPYYQEAVFDGNNLLTPAIASVGYFPTGGTDFITVNKNTGVLFRSMASTYKDGSDAKFFDNILGFDLGAGEGSIISEAEAATYTVAAGTCNGFKFTTNPPIDGVNITGGYIPLSAETNLTGARAPGAPQPQPTWQGILNIVQAQVPFFSTTDDTYDILAGQKNTQKNQYRFGYYLVSVTGDFRSQFYTKDVKQNIMAIVSRYYENNSFTSGTSDDSVIYIHSGAPINLQKFNVKILKPDKTIADNLGPESAIYLEIVKGESQQ